MTNNEREENIIAIMKQSGTNRYTAEFLIEGIK